MVKVDDVIRDYTQTAPGMENIWMVGGRRYVLYRVVSVVRGVVIGRRYNSPGWSDREEGREKEFSKVKLSKPSYTKGIWEFS